MVLVPFGSPTELTQAKNPWRGFVATGPVLTVIRVQKVSTIQGNPSCEAWSTALGKDDSGRAPATGTGDEWKNATRAWEPWREDDLDAIVECSKMPCDVKLNEYETLQMASVSKEMKQTKFLAVVLERVQKYIQSESRKEYEFAGDPVDPWQVFEKAGLKSPLPRPAKMELYLRKVDLAPGRVRAIRQVVDARVVLGPEKRGATLWRRDVYTDHYFDSWGEWVDVKCEAESAWVTQALVLELDLMKKSDFLSKLMRSKMRSATEENGAVYLDRWFNRLRAQAEPLKH